jgi:peroxiredoxin
VSSDRFIKVVLILAVTLLGAAWIVQSREQAGIGPTEGLTEAPMAGYAAPDFTLSLTTGETVSLSDFRGQPVVLNFWATWCPPCRAEIPFFQNASRQYNGQVAVLGINDGESLPTVSPFVTEFGMTYPVLLDIDSEVSILYRVAALPTTIFIDRDGVIQEVFPGIINQAVLESRIEALIGG